MKKNHWRLIVTVLAVIVLIGLAGAFILPTEGSRGVLYRVTGGEKVMYLLGSIHVGSDAMYPFGEGIRKAMAASDTFVYECDTTSEDALSAMRARMALGEGESLRAMLGDALYDRLTQVCGKIDLSMDTVNKLKPWAVVNTLAVYTTSAEMGADSVSHALSLGVEKQVEAYAAANRKGVAYLETLGQQVDVLEGFSTELQHYLLQSECDVILNPSTAKGMDASIASWPEWWREGDTQAFADAYLASYLEPSHQAVCMEYHKKLVTNRNQHMADGLVQLLKGDQACFVTVGLLHLALPQDSVVQCLRDKGYTVEQISIP